MLRVIVAIVIATLAGAVGQVLLRKGMQIAGPLETYAPIPMLTYFVKAILQPT